MKDKQSPAPVRAPQTLLFNSDPNAPWMAWMNRHLGEIEHSGYAPTPFDREIFSHTSYPLRSVMEPGCAATVSAALEETGYKSAHNAAAQSYAHYGVPSVLKPGAIVGFNWSGNGGHADHVSFCQNIISKDLVACLGGNQSHLVKVSVYGRHNIVFIRWPVK